jgi:hypothetical protein
MVCFFIFRNVLKLISVIFNRNFADPVAASRPLPQEYIKIVPHPNSSDPTTKIIALSTLTSGTHSECPAYMPQPEPRPWAPFENLADFEYTETAILGLLPKWIVNKQLAGFNSNWAKGSQLTIKNFTEMDKVLFKARKHFVQVSRIPLLCIFIYSNASISSRVMLSLQLMRVKHMNLHLNIEIHGNGSYRSFKTSPWHRWLCGMQFGSTTAQATSKIAFMMNQTRLIHGGALM